MASHQAFKAWWSRNQGFVYILGAVGLNWFFSSKSNEELNSKVEKYHIDNRAERIAAQAENRSERIAGESRVMNFIQLGLSRVISDGVEDQKGDGKN